LLFIYQRGEKGQKASSVYFALYLLKEQKVKRLLVCKTYLQITNISIMTTAAHKMTTNAPPTAPAISSLSRPVLTVAEIIIKSLKALEINEKKIQ
jgi:hypothetical protein